MPEVELVDDGEDSEEIPHDADAGYSPCPVLCGADPALGRGDAAVVGRCRSGGIQDQKIRRFSRHLVSATSGREETGSVDEMPFYKEAEKQITLIMR